MKRKSSIGRLVVAVLLVVMMLSLTACSKNQVIKGTYQSADKEVLLICDSQLMYVVMDDEINVMKYTVEGNALTVGGNILNYDGSDDSQITIGSETYTKTRCPLSVRWRLLKWASSNRIKTAKLGIIQWAILDPIFMESTNSYGLYSMIGSWIAIVCLFILLIIVISIVYNIKQKTKKRKR